MKKIVFIPVFNYFESLPYIISFYRKNLDEAAIIIYNDGKKGDCDTFAKSDGVVLIDNTGSKHGLKYAIYQAYLLSQKKYKCDMIIINEHDVLPNTASLYACMYIFEADIIENFASVSCMYKHDGKYCYPSHINWFKDKPVFNRPDVGKVVKVGGQGIPFGFSIWKPNALEDISDVMFPDTWKLDSRFGEYVFGGLGLYHLRLLDYHVGHCKGGVNSWKV